MKKNTVILSLFVGYIFSAIFSANEIAFAASVDIPTLPAIDSNTQSKPSSLNNANDTSATMNNTLTSPTDTNVNHTGNTANPPSINNAGSNTTGTQGNGGMAPPATTNTQANLPTAAPITESNSVGK
jgi:hypothetical protein